MILVNNSKYRKGRFFMPRGVKKAAPAVEEKGNILDSFTNIGKADKNRFAKTAAKMGISQEELLSLMIQAVAKGKVKFATKTVYEVK